MPASLGERGHVIQGGFGSIAELSSAVGAGNGHYEKFINFSGRSYRVNTILPRASAALTIYSGRLASIGLEVCAQHRPGVLTVALAPKAGMFPSAPWIFLIVAAALC